MEVMTQEKKKVYPLDFWIKEAGYQSIGHFCDFCGINRRSFYNKRTRKTSFTVWEINHILNLLGVSYDEVKEFGGAGTDQQTDNKL